jgi:hypothetical protein
MHMPVGFQVQVNDDAPVRAGDAASRVLSAIVSYTASGNEIELTVGGLVAPDSSATEHLEWLRRELKVGDRIVLTVVNTVDLDPPVRRTPEDPELAQQRERRYYERLKARFERS